MALSDANMAQKGIYSCLTAVSFAQCAAIVTQAETCVFLCFLFDAQPRLAVL